MTPELIVEAGLYVLLFTIAVWMLSKLTVRGARDIVRARDLEHVRCLEATAAQLNASGEYVQAAALRLYASLIQQRSRR